MSIGPDKTIATRKVGAEDIIMMSLPSDRFSDCIPSYYITPFNDKCFCQVALLAQACKSNSFDNHETGGTDEMQEIYPKIDTSDVVVFGTPNYWFGPSAKMKLLIDRLLPYTSNKNLEGKKGILIVAAADGPEACGPLLEMFRMSFEYLNMKFIGHILGTAYEKKDILDDEKSMDEAFRLGFTL